MSLAKLVRLERIFDRFAPAFLLSLGLTVAAATAVVAAS